MDRSDLERFHHDLRAALVARIPLVDDRGKRLTVAKFDQLTRRCLAESPHALTKLVEPTNAVAEGDELGYPKWYRASLTSYAQSKSILPILEGLSVRPIATHEVRRAIGWMLIYLTILLAVAALGMYLLGQRVAPVLVEFEKGKLASAPDGGWDLLPFLPQFAFFLSCLFGLVVIWICLGGITRTGLWLGGAHYVRCQVSKVTLMLARTLSREGLGPQETVELSCAVTGAGKKSREDVESALKEMTDLSYLEQLAEFFHVASQKRLVNLKTKTPFLLVSVMGGMIVFVYCSLLFIPIAQMFNELPSVDLQSMQTVGGPE